MVGIPRRWNNVETTARGMTTGRRSRRSAGAIGVWVCNRTVTPSCQRPLPRYHSVGRCPAAAERSESGAEVGSGVGLWGFAGGYVDGDSELA